MEVASLLSHLRKGFRMQQTQLGQGSPVAGGSFVEEKPVQAGLACRPCALAGAEKLSENRPWGQGFFSALLTVRPRRGAWSLPGCPRKCIKTQHILFVTLY